VFLTGLAAACCVPRRAPAAAAASLNLEPLSGGLWRVVGAAANIVVAEGPGSLLLVDGGAQTDVAALERLLAQRFAGKSVAAVFNTHWHAAHTGFNAAARKRGADVIAHENTKLWLSTEVDSRWEGKIYPPQPANTLPNRTFHYGPQKFDFGGRTIEYGHLGQAHTDGDIFVRFPDANVIVGGGAVSPESWPIGDPASNGWLGGILAATKTLIGRADAQTKIVPGRGGVVGVDALTAQADMVYNVLQRIGEAYFKGQTFDELLALQPAHDYEARLGDPSQFLRLSWDTAWYHVNEIRRITR
jgi:glyoxylase-like metal-dependent hydrolase (beta-lactamase superfamily II)